METFEELYQRAERKWRLYDSSICHRISEVISESVFDNHNFYEFCKGFIFASLDNQEKITALNETIKDLEESKKTLFEDMSVIAGKFWVVTDENKKLRECAKFYADDHNWYESAKSVKYNKITNTDLCVRFKRVEVGGKYARETLEEIDRIK